VQPSASVLIVEAGQRSAHVACVGWGRAHDHENLLLANTPSCRTRATVNSKENGGTRAANSPAHSFGTSRRACADYGAVELRIGKVTAHEADDALASRLCRLCVDSRLARMAAGPVSVVPISSNE
jgi:hypothetical protein